MLGTSGSPKLLGAKLMFEPDNLEITLTLHDEDGDQLVARIRIALYEPQIDHADLAWFMTASDLEVSEQGCDITLVNGKLRYLPDDWPDWWKSAGIHNSNGLQALAAFRAFVLWCEQRKRGRGKRGPDHEGIARRDALLAAVLIQIANGASWRAAVETVLIDYEPESTRRESEALLQTLKRYMRRLPEDC